MNDAVHGTKHPISEVVALGPTLASRAKNADFLDCLEVFAQLLQLEQDGGRPHLMAVLLEPGGEVQIVTIGHASPGLTVQVDRNLELDVPQIWFGERDGYGSTDPA